MQYQEVLDLFTARTTQIFQGNLAGVYLHGSMAMGCFNPDKSDIDLIVVVEEDISDEQKIKFMEMVVELNEKAPAKGLELSVVKKRYCREFTYPTPYELHFSTTYLELFRKSPAEYIQKLKGTDKDLAAHFTIINQYGVVLWGAPVEDIFEKVPKEAYLDSILYDVENASEDILVNPMYVVLNLCRVAAFIKEGLVLSKLQGGEWGLQKLPEEYHELIACALASYTSDREMSPAVEKQLDINGFFE